MRKRKPSAIKFSYLVTLDLASPDYLIIKELREWLKRPEIKALRVPPEKREFFRLYKLQTIKNIAELSRRLGIPYTTLRTWRDKEAWRWD